MSKSVLLLLVALAIVGTSNSNPLLANSKEDINTTCTPSEDTCSYYLCLEDQLSCGEKGGVPMEFYYFCKVVQNAQSSYSPLGQIWLPKARHCIQDHFNRFLVQNGTNSCETLKTFAYAVHTECCVNVTPSICDLPIRDRIWTMIAGREAFMVPGLSRSMTEILGFCQAQRIQRVLMPTINDI